MMDYGNAYSLNDTFLCERLEQIIRDRKIEVVVETGIYQGRSTLEFCRMAPYVIGIDIDSDSISAAMKILTEAKVNNFSLYRGDSAKELERLNSNIFFSDRRALYFIDAHMNPNDYWPLPDEIKAIPRGKNVLVFHDIKVPDEDFNYSQFMFEDKLQDFTYDLMKPFLDDWSPTHRVEYNTRANGDCVGVAFVYP